MHFFIEENKLPNGQGLENPMTFGPDRTNPTTKFHVTTEFKLSQEAKAFACLPGKMIVQKSDSDANLVNVIIKPLSNKVFFGVSVRYFVYRGITLSSFFTESNGTYTLLPKTNSNNSEFMKSFWDFETKAKESFPNRPDPSPLNLGFGNSILETDPLGNLLLSGNRKIEEIFLNKTVADTCYVSEGTCIGNFTSSQNIGFEIVTNNALNPELNLYYLRKSSHTIDLSTINQSNEFIVRYTKDQILSFIDPPAFFGMFFRPEIGMGINTAVYDSSGVKQKPVNRTIPGSLYSGVISKFNNKNRIYLDIRSEKGLSYNYYNTYSDGIIINNGAPQPYGNNGWPIVFISTTTNLNEEKNYASFKLSTNENTKPVVHLCYHEFENTKLGGKNTNPAIYLGSKIETGNESLWTKSVNIYIPHDRSSSKVNSANYIKIYYFIGDKVSESTNRPWTKTYFDSAFCPIDLIKAEKINWDKIGGWEKFGINPNPVFITEPLDEVTGCGNFSYAAENGVYSDLTRILFYTKAFHKASWTVSNYKVSGSGKTYQTTYSKKLDIQNTAYTVNLMHKYDIICKEYHTADGDIKIVGINYYKDAIFNEKEDLMLLGLSKDELMTLQGLEGLSPFHPRYIFLESATQQPFLVTTDGYRYRKYNVKLQGLDNNGNSARISSNIIVYSRDNVCFCSSAFTSSEEVSEGTNEIEYHINENGNIKVNDNIDFSLVRKAQMVSSILVETEAPAYVGDNSNEQKITYKYIYANGNTADILQTRIVVANSMKNGGTITSRPIVNGNQISYNGYTYTQTYQYYGTNVDARTSYFNEETKNIITFGKNNKQRLYKYSGKKVFLVHLIYPYTTNEEVTVEKNNILFSATAQVGERGYNNFDPKLNFIYKDTMRHFGNPDLCAGVLGMLVGMNRAVVSTGITFGDATGYPSTSHVNGNGFDLVNSSDTHDIALVTGLFKFGFKRVIAGKTRPTLVSELKKRGIDCIPRADHNDHVHSNYHIE